MIVARCGSDTNHDWVVELDGVRVARFYPEQVWHAARFANKLRRELHGGSTRSTL